MDKTTPLSKLGSSLRNTSLATRVGTVVIVLIIAFAGYQLYLVNSLSEKIALLSQDLVIFKDHTASTTAVLREDMEKNHLSLATALNVQTSTLDATTKQLEQRVGSVTGTVNTLQKLSKTDPELLAKYSKVFFLNENYTPPRTVEIPENYKYSSTKAVSIHADVWPKLQTLIDTATRNGITLYVSSGYRPFDEQKALKGSYTVTYGAGTANQFSADQGYSEHQLGTTVDFLTTGIGGDLNRFEGTTAYNWLVANAHRYGFVLSYPKNNTFYVFEPWHWRYVGVKLATDLFNQGKSFYDLDQRAIDEYLVNFFE